MTLGHVPLAFVTLTVATHVYPDPTGKELEPGLDFSRPASIVRKEHRIRAGIAAVRGRSDRQVEYADLLSDLATVRFFMLKHTAFDLDARLTAYRIYAEHLPPNDSRAGSEAFMLAGEYFIRGMHAEAERYYAIAWRAERRNGRNDVGARAGRYTQLAQVYESAGKYDLAKWCTLRAIRVRESDRRHPNESDRDWQTAARLAIRDGDLEAARVAIRVLELARPHDDGVKLAKACYLIATGDDKAAGPILRDILAAESARRWTHSLFRADIRATLAGVVTLAGDPGRGQLLLLTAIDAYERTGGPRSPRYIDAVAEYERLFPDDAGAVAGHVAAIRAAAQYEELTGPEPLVGERP